MIVLGDSLIWYNDREFCLKKVKEEKSRRHFIENTRLFPESLFSPAAVDPFLIKRSKKGEKVQMLQSITSQKTW